MNFTFGSTLQSTHNSEKIDNATRSTTSKLNLKYSFELTKLSRFVYPYHTEEHLIFANTMHIYLWLLDDYVDSTSISLSGRRHVLDESLNYVTFLTPLSLDCNPITQLLESLLAQLTDPDLHSYIREQLQQYLQGVGQHLNLKN